MQNVAPSQRTQTSYLISLVVPVDNEEESIGPFFAALKSVMNSACLDDHFEIIFVDDGSHDQTIPAIRAQHVPSARVRVIELARNFGKEAALTAGLDYAEGDVIIPIDVDLQEPPELIPEMLQRWREGWDIVYAYRKKRQADSVAKRISAKVFYKVFNLASETPIPPNAGDFRLMDRRVVEVVRTMRERTRFMKGLLSWPGFSSTGVPFDRPSRAAGTGKWRPVKLWRFALDGLLSFTTVPLKVWTYIGAGVAGLSMFYAIWIVGQKLFFGIAVPGYASIIVAITFLGGLQLLSLGIIGEYIARIFHEIKGRPIYVLKHTYDTSQTSEQKCGNT